MQSTLTFRYKFISSRPFHIFDNRCDIQQAQWEVVYLQKDFFFIRCSLLSPIATSKFFPIIMNYLRLSNFKLRSSFSTLEYESIYNILINVHLSVWDGQQCACTFCMGWATVRMHVLYGRGNSAHTLILTTPIFRSVIRTL